MVPCTVNNWFCMIGYLATFVYPYLYSKHRKQGKIKSLFCMAAKPRSYLGNEEFSGPLGTKIMEM